METQVTSITTVRFQSFRISATLPLEDLPKKPKVFPKPSPVTKDKQKRKFARAYHR